MRTLSAGICAFVISASTVFALVASRASAQGLPTDDPSRPPPVADTTVESPPPEMDNPFKPEQSPLVVPPPQPSKPKPREVNTLPLVSKDAPPPLIWKWRTFTLADYIVTATGAGITLGAAIVNPRSRHSLSGGVGIDDDVRESLRANKLADRYLFRDASDVGLSLAVSWPFAVDALTTAWWYRGSRETAQEMALINLQALAVNGALQGATNVLVSRERPFGEGCGQGELPANAIDCEHSFHYRSFFSGHASFSFTSAALICIHHLENELLGPPWDAVSCATGYGVAATTATFRVVADVHYASDVLIGAAVGTLVGFSVPLLHYRNIGGGSRERKTSSNPSPLQLHLVPAPSGIGLVGIF